MTTAAEFQVQKAGLVGDGWKTVCRASEAQARATFQRQLRLYSVGRFRLVDPSGKVVEEKKAIPLFSDTPRRIFFGPAFPTFSSRSSHYTSCSNC